MLPCSTDVDLGQIFHDCFFAAESADDVLLEIQVPFWIDADDVRVDIGEQQLHVYVRNTYCFCRTYWTNR